MKKVLFPKRYVGGGWERRQLFYMKRVDNRKRNDEKSLFTINFYFTAYLPDVCRPNSNHFTIEITFYDARRLSNFVVLINTPYRRSNDIVVY